MRQLFFLLLVAALLVMAVEGVTQDPRTTKSTAATAKNDTRILVIVTLTISLVVLLGLVILIVSFICFFCRKPKDKEPSTTKTPGPSPAPVSSAVAPSVSSSCGRSTDHTKGEPVITCSESGADRKEETRTDGYNWQLLERFDTPKSSTKTSKPGVDKPKEVGKSSSSKKIPKSEYTWKDAPTDPTCPYALAELVRKNSRKDDVEMGVAKTQPTSSLAKDKDLDARYRSKNSPDFYDAKFLDEITLTKSKDASAGKTPVRRKKKSGEEEEKKKSSA